MFINQKKVYQLDVSKKEDELVSSSKSKATTLTTLFFLDELVSGSEQEKLLLKILGAVNLKEENYVFISRAEYAHLSLMHFDAHSFPSLKNVIVFGLKSDDISLNTISMKYFNMTTGAYHLLFADDLSTLQNQAALKGQLWNNLKVMFEVK
ncbi:MAG: hypothetical protein R2728_13925 [Chitinophagales bacterium]